MEIYLVLLSETLIVGSAQANDGGKEPRVGVMVDRGLGDCISKP